ncbi:MAG TPA: signal peptidase II [Dehalococcoidia bacterium]|nr:signal peptidase II [Dehalococcoidia bacterium]
MHSTETTEAPPSRFGHPLARGIFFWGAALIVVTLDQITKAIIRSSLDRGESWPDADWFVRIRYVTNSGASFGMLQDQTSFLIIMAFIGLAAIYLYYRYPPFEHGVVPIAIGMMLGGAAGNLIDRIRVGRVTDFIDFRFWPAFNVADSSISIGIVVLLAGYIFLWPGTQDRPPDADG